MLIESIGYIYFVGIGLDPTMSVHAVGCSVERVSTGIYDITLDRAAASDEVVFRGPATFASNNAFIFNIENLSDTVKRLRAYNPSGGPPPFPLSDNFQVQIGFGIAWGGP